MKKRLRNLSWGERRKIRKLRGLGLSYREVAGELGVHYKTVYYHANRVYAERMRGKALERYEGKKFKCRECLHCNPLVEGQGI